MFSFRSILLAAAAFATMVSAIPIGPLHGTNDVSSISEATDLLHDLHFGYDTDTSPLLLPAPLKRSPQDGNGGDSGYGTEALPAPLELSTPEGEGEGAGAGYSRDETETERRRALGRRLGSKSPVDIF